MTHLPTTAAHLPRITPRQSALLNELSAHRLNLAEARTAASRTTIPDRPGLYALWWTGDVETLAGLHRTVSLKGKIATKLDVDRGEDCTPGEHISERTPGSPAPMAAHVSMSAKRPHLHPHPAVFTRPARHSKLVQYLRCWQRASVAL